MEKLPDLNLLLHLSALVRCASVSRAAEHLGITQSAMSAALSRMRRLFNDPLLVREAGGMRLTERAIELGRQFQPMVEQWLDLTLTRVGFDPMLSRRAFTLYATDYAQFAVLPRLGGALLRDAPGVQLTALPARLNHGLSMLESNHVEFVIGYYPDPSDSVRTRPLFSEPIVCLMRAGHPASRVEWNVETWLRHPHLDLAAHTRNAGEMIDRRLADNGLQRQVGMTLSSYLAAPAVVAGSDLFANLPRSIALHGMNERLAMRELPLTLPPIQIGLYWHERYQDDAGHAWLRQYVARHFQAAPAP